MANPSITPVLFCALGIKFCVGGDIYNYPGCHTASCADTQRWWSQRLSPSRAPHVMLFFHFSFVSACPGHDSCIQLPSLHPPPPPPNNTHTHIAHPPPPPHVCFETLSSLPLLAFVPLSCCLSFFLLPFLCPPPPPPAHTHTLLPLPLPSRHRLNTVPPY